MIHRHRVHIPEHKDLDLRHAQLSLSDGSGTGTFSGYASLFGIVDLANDIIESGAFAASLMKRGPAAIRLLWQHDPGEVIGRWTRISEDATGLFVEGELTLEVARARELQALMAAGALDGLSIGFRTLRARNDVATGSRHILEVDLWEISIVTFPMQPGARIASVKSGDPDGVTDTIAAATRALLQAA